MKYRRKLVIIPLFFVAAVAASLLFTIHAQRVNPGLQVHPSNFDVTIQPGVPTTQTVYLENHTDNPIPIKVDARNFTASGEEGAVNLTSDDTTYSLAKWINITPKTVVIPANSNQKFTFTISAPANAEAGGHYGSIVFATDPTQQVNGTGAVLSQQVASLILARVPGDVVENASVTSFTTDKNFYEFGPVTFTALVKNDGGVHIQPKGEILVKGTFGDTYNVDLQPYNVLPGASRKIPVVLSHKLLIGRYTALLVSAYGDKNEQLTGSTEFIAFPVRYGLVVLAVLFIFFLMRKRIGKAFKALATGK